MRLVSDAIMSNCCTDSSKFRDAEEMLQGSSEDEMFQTPMTKTYDQLGADCFDFLLGTRSGESLTELHPSPVRIFRLWQTFLDNVNPYVLFHQL